MALLKQKTISVGDQKQRIGLKKKKNRMGRGGKHQYELVDLDTDGLLEDPFTNKQRAMREFNQAAKDIERGMKSAKKDNRGVLGEEVDVPSINDATADLFPDDDIL